MLTHALFICCRFIWLNFTLPLLLILCLSSFPFTVSVVLKERRSKDSVTLAWQGPERPNGAIVEYEVIYYEKVRHTHTLIFKETPII